MPMNSRLLVPRAFSPANIPGLAAWLDAADEGTQVVDVGVTSWRSKTPGGLLFTQATGSAQPGIGAAPNGRRALTFNGTTQAISAGITSLFAAVPGVTIFAAFSPDNAALTPGYTSLVDINTPLSNDRAALYPRESSVEAGGRRLDADSYQFVQQGTTSNGVFCVGSGVFDYESATLAAGLNLSSSNRGGGFQSAGLSSNTNGSFSVGGNVTSVGGFGNFFDGTIGEVVVYNRPLNTAERQRIIRWLASRWGVVL